MSIYGGQKLGNHLISRYDKKNEIQYSNNQRTEASRNMCTFYNLLVEEKNYP